mmetsp:Transcript_38882/g.93530  ORF Transcript_38882/g.93530 Transcript_38882/m.93530 type:complete len:106 (-) Transcript_38882:973-1290(-)
MICYDVRKSIRIGSDFYTILHAAYIRVAVAPPNLTRVPADEGVGMKRGKRMTCPPSQSAAFTCSGSHTLLFVLVSKKYHLFWLLDQTQIHPSRSFSLGFTLGFWS